MFSLLLIIYVLLSPLPFFPDTPPNISRPEKGFVGNVGKNFFHVDHLSCHIVPSHTFSIPPYQ